MSPRYRGVLIALVLLLGGSSGAAPAAAQVDDCPGDAPDNPAGSPFVWNEAQCLSASENNGEAPQVAIAEGGTAIAVWRYQDPRNNKFRVQYSVRERGENFTPAPSPPTNPTPQELAEYNAKLDATFLSPADRDVGTHIRIKMNKAGDAIVVWDQEEGNGAGPAAPSLGVHSAYRPAGGDFGAAQTVAADPGDPTFASSYAEPEVGIDGQGNATVMFHRPPLPFGVPPLSGRQNSVYTASTRPAGAGSTWSQPQSLVDRETGSETNAIGYTDTHGRMSVNEAGDRWASFAYRKYGGQDGTTQRQVVKLAERGRNDATWHQRTEQDTPANTPDPEVTNTFTELQGQGDITRGLFAWSVGTELRDEDEAFNPPYPASTDGSEAAIRLDPVDSTSPDILALWSDAQRRLRASRKRDPLFNQQFSAPDAEPIPGNAAGERTRPDLVNFDDGANLAVFQQKEGSDTTVQAALLPKDADTDFQDPIALSAPGDLESDGPTQVPFPDKAASGPQIVANASGEAVASWSAFDGANFVVQVAVLAPRSDPEVPAPPPPPARPRPAVTSPIQLARAVARDQATVLIAEVPDDVEKVQWKFDSKDEPAIEGTTEGGRLQRTVRLRLPGTAFRASLRTFGPDGVKDYSRTLGSLQPSASKETQQVVAGLQKAATPPVFAVGQKEVLTGESGECAPTKVWTGEQKMSGCLKPMEGLVDLPGLERGALHEMSRALKLDETKKEVMDKATQLTDGYVAKGRALLNDEFPVIPRGGASVVSIAQSKSLVSAQATLPVGSASYDPKNGFNLKVDPKKVKIPLGKLPKPPKLPSLSGLEVVGDWDVDLDKQEAKITASVKLPPAIKKAGVQISNKVVLRATRDRVIVDEVRVGPVDVDIASLRVDKFQIQYKREPDQWDGQGKACLIGTACLDMIPHRGGVTIKNGDLARAGASLTFPAPGLPLFTGVNLERVGFGIGLRPTRVFGSARVGVGQLIKLDGQVFVAFPTSQAPFVLDRQEVGNSFPGHLYGQRFTKFTFGATAEAYVAIPLLGETKLASAYVLYEYPGYVAFGGGFDATFIDLLGIRGGVAAEADVDRGAYDLHGEVEACLYLIELDLCQGAVGHVSRGPGGTGGAGACVKLGPVSVGGGVKWNDLSDPYLWPIDGCKWSPFRIQVRQSAAAVSARGKRRSADRLVRAAGSRAVRARQSRVGVRAAGKYTVRVEKHKPYPVLRLDGLGTAPSIRVSGPGGTLEAPANKGFANTRDGTLRIMRFHNRYASITSVGFQNAKPGLYTVETLPGSAPVRAVQQATNPPDAKVTGKVTGKGRNRVLRYEVARRPAQKVVFSELTAGGAAKEIGSTTGGRGRIRFQTAPGYGRRTIVAQFGLSGMPAERKRVTTFKPQSPTLARPRGIRLKRKGGRLRVAWRRVPGARTYQVAVQPSSRRMVFATTRGTRASLALPRWVSGSVTVRATDGLRQSMTARRGFRAVSAQPSPFRPLQNCRVSRTSIRCLPPKRFCAGRRATIVSEPGRRTLGTAKADVIVGTPGTDIIQGRGGNDLICGDAGDDTITGGAGADRIRGGAGMDSLFGNSGNDRIRGGPGNDALRGDVGNDGLRGDSGNDTITGDLGRDKLSSGPNRDTLDGGSGKDRLNGGAGRDRLNGGSGRDRLRDDSRRRARDAKR